MTPISPAIALLEEVTTANTQQSVIFAGIPQIYRDLMVVARGRGTRAANTSDLLMQFNEDSSATYLRQFMDVSGTQVLADATATNNGCNIGALAGANATTGFSGATRVIVFSYRDNTFFKTYTSQSGTNFLSPAGQDVQIDSGMWLSTAAIDHIVVVPVAGNFVDGSIVSLYGMY